MGDSEAKGLGVSLSATLRIEMQHILDDPSFQNTVSLSRLLKFLVDETINGRSDGLKSYSIAVDGLGRPDDFDAQSDSYPRVQVGRLKKALASYYARNTPPSGSCLYLKSGSYRVRLGPPSTAYPELYGPLSLHAAVPTPPGSAMVDSNIVPWWALIQRSRSWQAGLLATVCVVLCFAIWPVVALEVKENGLLSQAESESPVLYISPASHINEVYGDEKSRALSAILIEGLSQAWTIRTRVLPNVESKNALVSSSGRASYRLDTEIIYRNNFGHQVFFRLTNVSSNVLLWSHSEAFTDNQEDPDDLLRITAQVVGQLAGPFGVIANEEHRRANGSFLPGYHCLLQALSYYKFRRAATGAKSLLCLQFPINDKSLEAVRLTFLATFALAPNAVIDNQPGAYEKSTRLAQQAIQADPRSAYAHMAMARVRFLKHQCDEGKRHGDLSVAAAPYDPMILSTIGSLSALCGHSEGSILLERAYELHSEGQPYARLILVWAAVKLGKFERLNALREVPPLGQPAYIPNHYLSETLIDAAQDRPRAATRNWKLFVKASHMPGASPDELVRQVFVGEDIRKDLLNFLKQKGVILQPYTDTPTSEKTAKTGA
jgi:hypothetical protein